MAAEPLVHSERHFKFLDATRGIAALMVFAGHYIGTLFKDRTYARFLYFLFNSHDAVSYFFVLSGFVLSYKYIVLNKPLDIKQFYVARIFRIFPAYFIIVLANALIAQRPDFSFQKLSDVFVLNKTQFWNEALLLRFHNVYFYPGWTLTIEMVASFLIPFYIAIAIKDKRLIPVFILVTLVIGNDIFFSYTFLFGMIISTYYSRIAGIHFEKTKWWRFRFPLLIFAIILFSVRQFDGVLPFGPGYNSFAKYLGINFYTYTSLSCFAFLAFILHSKRTQYFLENKILVFLGKISYSIYLVHTLVIGLIYMYEEPYIRDHGFHLPNLILSTVVCTSALILLASLVHYCVELPFMRLGKRVASSLRPSLVIKREPD